MDNVEWGLGEAGEYTVPFIVPFIVKYTGLSAELTPLPVTMERKTFFCEVGRNRDTKSVI